MKETTNNTSHQLSEYKESLIHGTYIDIFANEFGGSELSAEKLYIHTFDEIPFCYTSYTNIDLKELIADFKAEFQFAKEDYLYQYVFTKNKKPDKIDWRSSGFLFRMKDKVFVELHSYKVVLYHAQDTPQETIDKLIAMITARRKKKKHSKKFYMVANSKQHGFELRKYKVKKQLINLEENYNDDFIEINDIITTFLKKKKNSGLVLLHGKFGTGKTSYLRHIMETINKRFIFLPLHLMTSISSPNFLPFISKYKDSVLVLEDCEDLLVPRGQKPDNNSLVNLLNLGDGLLSDALSLKIICTFNADIKQIDQAILRKGRLVARYEFKELEKHKVQQIYDKLGYTEKAEKPLTLADIYNKKEKNFELQEKKALGFRK